MRIVQALASANRGSAERFFVRLANALQAREIPQVIITPRKAWAEEQLAQAGISVQTARFGGKFDFITRAKYRRVLQTPSASLALNWMPHAAAACPPGPWVRVARLGKCYPIDAFASCDHLIANSPRIAAHMVSHGWPSSRVSTIPNFVPEVRTVQARRAAFNTPEDAALILWLGSMVRDKGPDLIVRALAQVPQAYLWMAGDGPCEDEVKKLSAQMGVLGRIRFLGWRDEIHPLLKAADIFVRCSRGEGLGNVLEAWAHGLPLISARSTDTDGLIAHGQTGLLVENGDPAALACALRSLIGDRNLARRLGEAGRSHFRAHFSEEPVVTMYLDLCRRLEEDYAWRTRQLPRTRRAGARPSLAST